MYIVCCGFIPEAYKERTLGESQAVRKHSPSQFRGHYWGYLAAHLVRRGFWGWRLPSICDQQIPVCGHGTPGGDSRAYEDFLRLNVSLLDCWEVAVRVTSVSATPSPVCTEKVGLGLSGEGKGPEWK